MIRLRSRSLRVLMLIAVSLITLTASPRRVIASEVDAPGITFPVATVPQADQTTPADPAQPPITQTIRPPLAKVVITEVMQNPSMVWDSLGEWFELHNAGEEAVDLAGWTITDELNDEHVVEEPLVVPAGEYIVIARNPDLASNGGVATQYTTGSDMFLFNSADRVVLLDGEGREIDRVVWDDGATFPDPNGASMSLRQVGRNNAEGKHWCVATTVFGRGDLGTPGRPNTCQPGAPLVISEVMQNSSAVSDANGDWFEIHNPTGSAVDINGWTIADYGTDSHTVAGTVVVAAGGYAVIARSGDPERNGGVTPDYVTSDDILFHNNFDELVLIDDEGVRIDRVAWDDGRTFPDPTGASMSLRHVGSNNEIGGNWCRATTPFGAGDFGTPGQPNTCDEPVSLPPMAVLTITEIMANPSTVSDNEGEWFEVYNHEAEPIDLNGWIIRDFDTNVHVINNGDPLVVPARDHVVLGRNAQQATNGGVAVDYAYGSSMVLYNASDEIVLVDPNGTIVDQVAYDDGRTFPDPEGASIALENLSLRNDVGAHWCVASTSYGSGDSGSPGEHNTCGPTAPMAPIVVNEIMANPADVPDSVGEWFELYNPTEEVVDLNGWTIRDDDYNFHVIDNGGPLNIPAGGYVVLGRNANTAANGGVQLDYAYGSKMVLYNAADELILVDSNHVEVDRVEWDDGLTFPDPVGASMSLSDPALDNSVGANWCVSGSRYGNGERGTPGSANECGPACYVDGLTVAVTATPDALWPPNGRLHHVTTRVEILDEEPDTTVTLVDVVSDEEDGKTNKKFPDIVIIDDYNFELRAERNGWGDGRTYTITYAVTTACGQEETFSTHVVVPHDQGRGAH